VQGIQIGGKTDVGGNMGGYFQGGTVSMGGLYGPGAGPGASVRASTTAALGTYRAAPSRGLLSLPVVAALGVLVWYVTRSY
jgi:hypothetical protein